MDSGGGDEMKPLTILLILDFIVLSSSIAIAAEQIATRFTEGVGHGFLALRSLDGKLLADGEISQLAKGDRVTGRLIFRFKDGSVYEDATVFSQRGSLRLLNDHLLEKGPSFKRPMETWLDTTTGEFTCQYTADDGSPKSI